MSVIRKIKERMEVLKHSLKLRTWSNFPEREWDIKKELDGLDKRLKGILRIKNSNEARVDRWFDRQLR